MSESTTPWIKAIASSNASQCVEMRQHNDRIEVRDSKNPDGPALLYTRDEFAAWLDGAKKGEFDHLI